MISRTLLEWETLGYGDDPVAEIPVGEADRLAAVAAASPLAGHSGGVLEHGRKGLRARGVVGIIAAEGCALEILPKIDFPGGGSPAVGSIRQRLIHMLAVALDLRIEAGMVTSLDCQRETLLEILIRLFSEKLTEAVRQGMPRSYIDQADDLRVLRGRLDCLRQFTTLIAQPGRLACRYEVLSPDIALNQIMKAAIVRLARLSGNQDNQRRLRELAFVYADIADMPIAALHWDKVVLDRTNGRWRELLSFARLLLGDRFQTTSAGGQRGFSLLFEMNTLFEQYVARKLALAVAKDGVQVVSQGGRLFCLETDDNRGLFQTRPDILIKRGNKVLQVIDTKWKRVATKMDDPKRGVAQADVYQMMAYGRLYQCDSLMLLYPHHAALPDAEGILATHRISGSDHRLNTATIDVAVGSGILERLRALTMIERDLEV